MDFLFQNMQVLFAAVIVLVVLIVGLSAWRRFSPGIAGRRGQRLGITEYYELDKTRRLVLVRRDNVEHLILIGGEQDIVIEQGITVETIAAAYEPPAYVEPPPPVRAPRPPVFGDRRPPVRAAAAEEPREEPET